MWTIRAYMRRCPMERSRQTFLIILAVAVASIWFWHHNRDVSGDRATALRKQQQQTFFCTKTDRIFDGVRVRTYEPPASVTAQRRPGIVYFHGGGWVNGTLDAKDAVNDRLCQSTGAVLVSVDYRLAPKVVFPVPFEDCLRATQYFFKHTADFKVDEKRLALAGDSAGGNLAAATSLRLNNDDFSPRPKLQLLFFPVLQGLDFQLPSMLQNAVPPGLTSRAMCRFTALYLEGRADHAADYCDNAHVPADVRQQYATTHFNLDRLPAKFRTGYARPEPKPVNRDLWDAIKGKLLNQYFSPLLADRLTNLPTTYLLTVERDPLRDEGFLYAERLKAAGNDVTHRHSNEGHHGRLDLRLDDVITFIQARL